MAVSGFRHSFVSSNNPTPTWYEDWLEKSFYALDPLVSDSTQAIYECVLSGLQKAGIVFERNVGARGYWGLLATAFQVTTEVVQFRCKFCSFGISVGMADDSVYYEGSRCMRYNCDGHFERLPATEDYYRRLYESGDVKRIFSAEHTGLLERDTREDIESGFRKNDHPGDPNLLSCTPTLEMGINIGDLLVNCPLLRSSKAQQLPAACGPSGAH